MDSLKNKKLRKGVDRKVKPINPDISKDINAIIAKLLSQKDDKIGEDLFGSVDHCFSKGELLYSDVLNFWSHLNMSFKLKNPKILLENLNKLEPLPHYQEGYENMGKAYDNLTTREECEQDLKRIMALSNPAQIQRYNNLVDEFNADLERIKKEKDFSILDQYFQRARSLV